MCDINLKCVSMQENEVTFEYDKHKIFELNTDLKHNVVTFFSFMKKIFSF